MSTMRVDESIKEISNNIEFNIEQYHQNENIYSQNILSQLRNLTERVITKIANPNEDVDPLEYDVITKSISKLQEMDKKYRFVLRFHKLLKLSVSHYTNDGEASRRMLMKYQEFLVNIRKLMKNEYNTEILSNLNKLYFFNDKQSLEYYSNIAKLISNVEDNPENGKYVGRYYIQSIRPFCINDIYYYEITFIDVFGQDNKFDRITAYSKERIPDYYSIKFELQKCTTTLFNIDFEILIIRKWETSIRPCELAKIGQILGIPCNLNSSSKEYERLMDYLTATQSSFTDLLHLPINEYSSVMDALYEGIDVPHFKEILDQSYFLIQNEKPGNVLLSYLLLKLNNTILKAQQAYKPCSTLSNLYVSNCCIPFDEMPFASSLCNHNPEFYEVIESVDPQHRSHELFARFFKNTCERESTIFLPEKLLNNWENTDNLCKQYNEKLYYTHQKRKIVKFKTYFYLEEHRFDLISLLEKVKSHLANGYEDYEKLANQWLTMNPTLIDCETKKEIIKKLFVNSTIGIINGPAGTGKTTLIKYVTALFSSLKKVYLANTNPAVDNLRQKIGTESGDFLTISKFISSKKQPYDILIIDECSTISNHDILSVLADYPRSMILLVGDEHQLESIRFGNWFNILREILSNTCVFELSTPYRSDNEWLLTTWDHVRKNDSDILELLSRYNFTQSLDSSLFNQSKDEVILCLNYNGAFGINSINYIMQSKNPSLGITWGLKTYKNGDPVLFNYTNRFKNILYNNSKGTIYNIVKDEKKIKFHIELDHYVPSCTTPAYTIENIPDHNSIIIFDILKCKNTDEDYDKELYSVPFNVAYAVSIHKAQGLEYDSVKIVITDEVQDSITHNIFYTAITRCKNKLKIYWSDVAEKNVLSNLTLPDVKKDIKVLKNYCYENRLDIIDLFR